MKPVIIGNATLYASPYRNHGHIYTDTSMIENAFNKPDPELLPCPLCGNSDVFFLKPVSGVGSVEILCSTKGCIGMVGYTMREMAKQWNRRIEKAVSSRTLRRRQRAERVCG